MSTIVVNENIVLKTISLEDKDRLQSLANQEVMRKNVGDNMPYPYTLADAERWINHCKEVAGSEHEGQYGIYIDGMYAGNIGRERKEGGRKKYNYHIGYRIGEPYRGHGYMTEIVKAFTHHVFTTLPCHRCYSSVFGRNEGSKRVLEKAGFSIEGVLKEAIYYEGARYDEHLFSKINENQVALTS